VCLKNIITTESGILEKTSVSRVMRGGGGEGELILNWSQTIIIRQVLCSHTMFKPDDREHKTKSIIPLSFCASLKS
jgi:hypothetical protein